MDARDEVVLTLTDDIDSEEATVGMGPFKASTRNLVMAGHLAFRGMALLTYLFGSWFVDSFIVAFTFILINLSLDFWFVKNVSGRVLVGMRWSSQAVDNGTAQWCFDTRPSTTNETTTGQSETTTTVTMSRREKLARAAQMKASYVFWIGLFVAPLLWALFSLTSLLSLHPWWALVAVIGLTMSSINLYAFARCRLSGGSSAASGLLSTIQSKVSRQLFTDLFSNLKKASSTSDTTGGDNMSSKPTLQA